MSWRTNRGNKGNVRAQRTRYEQSRAGRPWAVDEDNALTRLFDDGKEIPEIANRLGRAEDAVVFRLIRLGAVGYNEDGIPARHGMAWSYHEVEQFKAENSRGLDIGEMARNHLRLKNAILCKLIEFRLINFSNRSALPMPEVSTGIKEDDAPTDNESTETNSNKYVGGENMAATKNTGSKVVDETPSLIGTITGRNDAIFLKNKYQEELDKTYSSIVEMTHYLDTKNGELKEIWSKIPAVKKNIEAHQKERADLYTNLGNVLTKETNFEDKMWQTTQKGRKANTMIIKQKFNDSDVDEMRYDSMMDYLKQYPEYASKSTFKKILDKIEQKEGEIRKETEKYNDHVSDYNFRLNNFEKDIKKAEDKITAYSTIKKEAEGKLADARYNKSFLKAFRSERSKAEANLDLLSHRVEQFRNTLEIIKSEHSQNKRKAFTDMEF